MNRLPRIPVWLILIPLALVAFWSLLLPAAHSFASARAAAYATAHPQPTGSGGSSTQSCVPADAQFRQGNGWHHHHHFGFGFGPWFQPTHNDMQTCPPGSRPAGQDFRGRGWFRFGASPFPMHHPGGPGQAGAFH
jgi:hypothetical protein